MPRQTHIVDLQLRVELNADSTFDHEDVKRMINAMFYSARRNGLLEEEDGKITKLVSADATFLDEEGENSE